MNETNQHDSLEEREDDKPVHAFDMERVQFLDMDSFRRVNECVLIVMREYARLEHPPTEWELEQALIQGYPRSDGSLLVRSISPDGRNQDTIVPALGWRQLSTEEYEKFDEHRTWRKNHDPDGYEASIDHLAELIRKPGDDFAVAEAGKAQPNVSVNERTAINPETLIASTMSSMMRSYAIILDRSDAAEHLIERIDQQSEFDAHVRTETAEFRRQHHQPYFVLWRMLDASDKLTLTPSDLKALLSDALPTVMQRVKMTGGTCTFLIGTEIDDSKLIEERLASLQSAAE
ncbi:hypothetical protein [Paraburkholderia sp. C35]|uniref:hypothetical protein n=1 Tax=Paraburkholderia sp. C35 TaxID=2126993 RepID=UPI000D68CC2A|nr:hypothetical protein [Paraburkholderia sp. C35]